MKKNVIKYINTIELSADHTRIYRDFWSTQIKTLQAPGIQYFITVVTWRFIGVTCDEIDHSAFTRYV